MNSKESWQLRIRDEVYKTLRKFPANDNKKILEVIKNLSSDPYAGDIEKMKGGGNLWRRRVGAYRIFFELIVREKIVQVFRVERRTSQTY